jgi:juvenile-hormone esterase
VLVYIYGGGFFAGIAGPSINGPDYFMETEKVVMVFMSYRVFAFGFLSTGDAEMSGNFGFKDQALAIKWTVKNIAKFGGNPKRISLIGQSAGAASVHYHLMSPQTRQLIDRVILMSGSGIASYDYVNRRPLSQATDLAVKAGILNAKTLSTKQLVQELLKLRGEDIINAAEQLKVCNFPIQFFRAFLKPILSQYFGRCWGKTQKSKDTDMILMIFAVFPDF